MPKKINIYYNRTNTCDRCREEGIETNLYPSNAYREYKLTKDIKVWTGKWLCGNCGRNNNEKINPNSQRNIRKSLRTRKYYNITNTCDRCGINFEKTSGHPYREYNKEGNWTGKWLCNICRNKDYYITDEKEMYKSLRDHRTGNLDPSCSSAKGDNFEELTRRWRSTISTIPVENLNEKYDNYTTPIDHSRDSELGIPQTKGAFYDSYNQYWVFSCKNERNKNKQFDVLICYCANIDGKTIERIYIFPKLEIDKRTGFALVKNPSKGVQWYEKYRVTDEETIKKVNDIWKEIINIEVN